MMERNGMTEAVWENCYDGGWGDAITPESFSHPAKMSKNLLERIFAQAGIDAVKMPKETP